MDIVDALNTEPATRAEKHAATEITRLRARLELDESGVDGIQCRDATIAGLEREIERLRADRDDLCTRLEKSGGREMDLGDRLEALQAELAAAQAREAKLRDALNIAIMTGCFRADAIAMPADDSALRERLRAERERIITLLLKLGALDDGDYINAIRALSDEVPT